MQFVRAAAHAGIVLLDEIPADFIFGDAIFLIGSGGIRGRRRVRGLEVGGGVHGSGVVGVGVRVLRREVAVDRSLGRVGHCGSSKLLVANGGRRVQNSREQSVDERIWTAFGISIAMRSQEKKIPAPLDWYSEGMSQ